MVKLFFWSLLSLVAIDIALNNWYERPEINRQPGQLSQYFNYGRSIEDKLFYRVADSNESAAKIAKAGWYADKNTVTTLKQGQDDKQEVYIYGMSFSEHIGDILSRLDKSLNVETFAGPGAPLNHSYTYYLRHRPNNQGDIVILGVLASSLPMLNTLTHMTSNFESPGAHFYPRYRLDSEDNLVRFELPLDTLDDLRQAMSNEEVWSQLKFTLKKEDVFYDSVLFPQNLTDRSTYLRLLKRAWGQKFKQDTLEKYHDNAGYKNTDRLIDISQSIAASFAQKVRSDGAFPIIILFNNRGYDDHLYRIMEPVLSDLNIEHYSTHNDFPATQLSNFLSDGHFTKAIDESIAMSVHEIIKKYTDD